MKSILLTTALTLIGLGAMAQDYMDKIVDESCKCLENIPDSLGKQEATMKMGLCMLAASEPYKKQLKKDHGIDFSKIDRGDGEKLGRIVGMKLATVCPSALMKAVNRVNPELLEDEAADAATLTLEGTVTQIETNTFVSFSVKDEDGKTVKFYWTKFVENDMDLINNYEDIQGKLVYIEYENQEMYDARLKEYRNFRVITAIEPLD